MKVKALDLCSGKGGWSNGLAIEGFEVQGIEIEPEIAAMYKHPVTVADVRDIDGTQFKGYDLIVASPPCRDFSRIGIMVGHNWKRPPDPEGEGMSIVNACLRIIDEAQPRYWLLENVPRLQKYLEREPRGTMYLGESMRRCFWGNYPAFLVPRDYTKGKFTKRRQLSDGRNAPICLDHSKYAKWDRAMIPEPVARALGRSVKAALSKSKRM